MLRHIVGEGARDRGGKGNANVGDGGVAFVLSSATNVPGGTDLVRFKSPLVIVSSAGDYIPSQKAAPSSCNGCKQWLRLISGM